MLSLVFCQEWSPCSSKEDNFAFWFSSLRALRNCLDNHNILFLHMGYFYFPLREPNLAFDMSIWPPKDLKRLSFSHIILDLGIQISVL